MFKCRSLILVSALFISACDSHRVTQKLRLIKAYTVDTKGFLEPSGLTLWDGEFYTISDKQDRIYHLKFEQNKIIMEPIIKIMNNRNSKLDFEGITHDQDNFYLVSEKYFQILKVSKDGSQQNWLSTDDHIQQAGKNVGLFQTHNANFEGICLMQNNVFLLAAERQPRGFMEIDMAQNVLKAYQKSKPVFNYQGERSADFTGLSCDDGMYALDRNADMVAKLRIKKGEYQEIKGYSYQHIVNQPQFKYLDMKYGQAEGLVVKGNKVYIILDNNRGYHENNSGNNNSLFLEMSK